MTNITPEQLRHLEAVEAAMTAGPWEVYETPLTPAGGVGQKGSEEAVFEDGTVSKADAQGIAAMRNAFPALIAEVRRLRSLLTS